MRKENNNKVIYSTILLPELPSSAILESTPGRNQHCLHSVDSTRILNVYSADYVDCFLGYSPKWHKTVTRGEENCWINYVIIVFFAFKKYSHSFIKLQLNHWCHMDYFTDVLATFLGLGTLQLHCCLRRVRERSDFIKNILIGVPKMNEGLTGLERHEGE